MRLILLNGAPRSGKDTAADAIVATLSAWRAMRSGPAVVKWGMSYALKEGTHALYGHPEKPHDAYENVKDKPHPDFFGLTPRQAYIAVSEKLMKPLHGKDVFGKIFVRRVHPMCPGPRDAVISPDAGFTDEWAPSLAEFGACNMLLIRVHAEARGCTFAHDSRNYINLPGVETVDLCNYGGAEAREAYTRLAVETATRWLG